MGGNDRQVWDRMEVLFGEALSMAPERRTAFLDEVCADDPALRTELESLLSSYDEASQYFDSLAADVLPSLLQDLDPSAASLSFPSRIGQEIGAYRIVEKLGDGGMGVVYKAHDTRLDRSVALKFLPPHLSSNPAAEQRFIREAKAASALDHPNICTIYEIGETDEGQLFIAMAYYAGETLKDRIDRESLSVEDAVDYATQIADGLSCAHRAGIIHRDIKPANVLITDTGVAKIVDFGLARGPASSLTKTGATMGTVAYMSPEQARGETVDARTDLWALGVVLYEMLTRERPFRAGNEHATLYAIQHEKPIPLSTLRSDVPRALQETVEHCLEKAPIARPETAAALATRLRSVGATGTDATPAQQLLHRFVARTPSPVLALIGLLVLGGLLWSIPPTRSYIEGALNPDAASGEAGSTADPLQTERGMVVLPCTDVEEDTASRALCTGLMVTLTDRFAEFRKDLRIWVVPASDIRERGASTSREAYQWYNVDLVLQGVVRRDNNQIHTRLLLEGAEESAAESTDAFPLPRANATTLQRKAMSSIAGMLGVDLQPDQLDRLEAGTFSPRAYEAYLQGRGHLWYHENPDRLSAAVDAFQQALAEDSAYASAHAGLSESYWRRFVATRDTQWVVEARQHAQHALELDAQLASAHKVLGLIHQGTRQLDEAVQSFQRARDLRPDRADFYRHLALVYEGQGLFEEAKSIYHVVAYQWDDYWVGHNDLGYVHMQQGQYEAAVTNFRRAADKAPRYFAPHNNLAALLHHLGRFDEARDKYQWLIDNFPNAGSYSNLGTVYFEEGRYADAIRMYEQALELENDDHSLMGNLAVAHYMANDRDTATVYYQEAAKHAEARRSVTPQSPLLLAQLGGYYAMLDQPDRALSLTKQATELAPDRIEVAFAAAATYEQLGRREQALQWIDKAVEGGYSLARIENDPTLRNLRTDVRYREIVQRHDSIS